jgi:hypothetical protein
VSDGRVRAQEGAYAIIVKSSLFPDEAVAARRGSPLLLGLKHETPSCESIHVLPVSPGTPLALAGGGDGSALLLQAAAGADCAAEYFLASDAAAIVEHTRQVMYLEDADLLHIAPAGAPPAPMPRLCTIGGVGCSHHRSRWPCTRHASHRCARPLAPSRSLCSPSHPSAICLASVSLSLSRSVCVTDV